MTTRDDVRQRMQDDNIQYLLAQFVDINGSPKVKMVPASHLDDVVDVGAGFAGAALPGMGQGPHSHDMLAKVDLDSYTPVPWTDGLARFASDLFVDDEPHMFCPGAPEECAVPGTARRVHFQCWHRAGALPGHPQDDGSISIWDPNDVDTLTKPATTSRASPT